MCYWCSCVLTPANRTKDHVIPSAFYRRGVVKGRRKKVDCCYTCNQARSAVTSRIIGLMDLYHTFAVQSTWQARIAEKKLVEGLGSHFLEWNY